MGNIVSALETIHRHWRDLFDVESTSFRDSRDRRMTRAEVDKYGKIFPKELEAWRSAMKEYRAARKAGNWAKCRTAKRTRFNAGKAFYAKVKAYKTSKRPQVVAKPKSKKAPAPRARNVTKRGHKKSGKSQLTREERAEFGKMFPKEFKAWREAGKRKLDARNRRNRAQWQRARQAEIRAGRAFFAKVRNYKKSQEAKVAEPKSEKAPAPKARKVTKPKARKSRMSKEKRMNFRKMFPEEFEAWKAANQKDKAAKEVVCQTRKRGGKAYHDAKVAFNAARQAMRTAGKAFWAKVRAYKMENAEKK